MKIDMHVHSEYSADSSLPLKEIIRLAKIKGLEGIAITDHNSTAGLRSARLLGGKAGIKIIPGIECRTDHGDVLGYGVNAEVRSRQFFEVIDTLRSQGATIAIAHPFDCLRAAEAMCDRDFLRAVRRKVDYLEINGRCLPPFNWLTRKFARKYDLPLIGGSDAHFGFEIGGVYSLVDERLKVSGVIGNGSWLAPYPLARTKLFKLFRL